MLKRPPVWATLVGKKSTFVSFSDAYPGADVIWSREYEPVSTPEALHFPFPDRAKHFNSRCYTPPLDFVAVVPEALYSPGNEVVVSPQRDVVEESCNTDWLGNIFKRELYANPVRQRGYAFLLRGPFKTYYHRLIEFLPRLIAVSQYLDEQGIPPSDVTLLVGDRLSDHERYLLQLTGLSLVKIKKYEPGQPVLVDRLIFTPFKSDCFSGYVPSPYITYIRKVGNVSTAGSPGKKIFISRREHENRYIENQRDIEGVLKDFGYEVHELGSMSFENQAHLFSHTKHIIGAHGAGFANMIFARSPKVLEIFPSHYMMPYYFMLSKSVDAQYYTMMGELPELRKNNSFNVNLSTLKDELWYMEELQ
jgi:hypothetical protein